MISFGRYTQILLQNLVQDFCNHRLSEITNSIMNSKFLGWRNCSGNVEGDGLISKGIRCFFGKESWHWNAFISGLAKTSLIISLFTKQFLKNFHNGCDLVKMIYGLWWITFLRFSWCCPWKPVRLQWLQNSSKVAQGLLQIVLPAFLQGMQCLLGKFGINFPY